VQSSTLSSYECLLLLLIFVLGLLVRQAFITRGLVDSATITLSLTKRIWLSDVFRISCASLGIIIVGHTARYVVQALGVDLAG
jgi:hypothetical protein